MSTATAEAPADLDRTPPQDIGAEQSVLGAMLLSKDAIGDVVEILHAVDFYQPAHGLIFQTIVDLYTKGDPADPITVAAALTDAGNLARVGGGSYVHTLLSMVPTAASGAHYARIVASRAQLRRLAEAGVRIAQLGYTPGDADDALDRAGQILFNVTGQRVSEGWKVLATLLQPTLDEIEASGRRDLGLTGIPTGFKDLDTLTNGLQPGQLAVFAGRPGQGKSTASLDVCRAAAIRHNIPAAFFTLEMSELEVTTRLLSAEARVPLHVLRSGMLSDDDWTRLARRMGEIAEAPLFIDDTPNLSLMEIRAKARRLVQLEGVKMLAVDYLQLMTTPGSRSENRQTEVDANVRGLKLLAKELGVPVIAVSQLNRGSEQRADKRPMLSDLRESGGIENHADLVMLIHRDDYYDKESARAGEADFILAKHRNGPTDTIVVASQLHFARFVDMAIS